MGASAEPTGLGAPEGAEPDTRLGASPAIPSAWTPGPWTYELAAGAINAEAWKDEYSPCVASYVSEANGHLIAAAPELYEALEMCRWELHKLNAEAPGQTEARKAAERALAKARGL